MRPSTLLGCVDDAHLGFDAGCLVADAQKQCERDEPGEQRRAALAYEGERQARQGDELGDAADDDERLQDDGDSDTPSENMNVFFLPDIGYARDQDHGKSCSLKPSCR